MIFARFLESSVVNPRVVMAAVQIRIPDGSRGFLVSNGIMFLLQEIPIDSSIVSASFHVDQSEPNTSNNIIWLSVPPEITRIPPSKNCFAIICALSIIWRTYVEKDGESASQKATAFARVV